MSQTSSSILDVYQTASLVSIMNWIKNEWKEHKVDYMRFSFSAFKQQNPQHRSEISSFWFHQTLANLIMTFLQNLCLILHKIEKSSSPWSKILFVKFLQRLFWWVINESSEDLKLKYIFQDVTFNIQSNGDLNKSWCLMENTHLNKMKIII